MPIRKRLADLVNTRQNKEISDAERNNCPKSKLIIHCGWGFFGRFFMRLLHHVLLYWPASIMNLANFELQGAVHVDH